MSLFQVLSHQSLPIALSTGILELLSDSQEAHVDYLSLSYAVSITDLKWQIREREWSQHLPKSLLHLPQECVTLAQQQHSSSSKGMAIKVYCCFIHVNHLTPGRLLQTLRNLTSGS